MKFQEMKNIQILKADDYIKPWETIIL